MIVMPANIAGPWIRACDRIWPGHLGNIISPGHWRGRPRPYYALDNGCFSQQKTWSAKLFWKHCDWAVRETVKFGNAPRWVAVPDVVGDWRGTLKRWQWWAPRLRREFGWPLAFVWQDDVPDELVRQDTDAEIQFVGGKEVEWKMETAERLPHLFPRVHVGRVNAVDAALDCFRWHVESIDGTGWMRTTRQRRGLIKVLRTMRIEIRHGYLSTARLHAVYQQQRGR
jgi:hypothetical protein